jgi:CYTH domain-containing protein
MLSTEIERRFLLSSMPDLGFVQHQIIQIHQFWLPGKIIRERFRSQRRGLRTEYWRTIKFGRGSPRKQLEEWCDSRLYSAMADIALRELYPSIDKTRFVVPISRWHWELDVFELEDRKVGYLMEVELTSRWTWLKIPDFFKPHIVREVTDDSRYNNLSIAENGWPEK